MPDVLPYLVKARPSCPVCQMTYEHEPGCPYEGVSMEEANVMFARGERPARQAADTGTGPEDAGNAQEDTGQTGEREPARAPEQPQMLSR